MAIVQSRHATKYRNENEMPRSILQPLPARKTRINAEFRHRPLSYATGGARERKASRSGVKT
ncbi:MAG: hypothetical protein WBD80_03545, partial [Xanthobacteraceae bacterium]